MICYAELLALKGHDSEAAFKLPVLLLESKEHELSGLTEHWTQYPDQTQAAVL